MKHYWRDNLIRLKSISKECLLHHQKHDVLHLTQEKYAAPLGPNDVPKSGGSKIFIKSRHTVSPTKILSKYSLNFHQNRLHRRPEAWMRA
jgi:hypothetical protein